MKKIPSFKPTKKNTLHAFANPNSVKGNPSMKKAQKDEKEKRDNPREEALEAKKMLKRGMSKLDNYGKGKKAK